MSEIYKPKPSFELLSSALKDASDKDKGFYEKLYDTFDDEGKSELLAQLITDPKGIRSFTVKESDEIIEYNFSDGSSYTVKKIAFFDSRAAFVIEGGDKEHSVVNTARLWAMRDDIENMSGIESREWYNCPHEDDLIIYCK